MTALVLLVAMATIACACGGWPLGGSPDYDGDGLIDSRDRCPRDPEDFDGFQDDDGCPDRDNDRDGIPDTQDRCPNDFGVPSEGGCPVSDGDRDGVPDRDDRCPNQAGDPKNGGCPAR